MQSEGSGTMILAKDERHIRRVVRMKMRPRLESRWWAESKKRCFKGPKCGICPFSIREERCLNLRRYRARGFSCVWGGEGRKYSGTSEKRFCQDLKGSSTRVVLTCVFQRILAFQQSCSWFVTKDVLLDAWFTCTDRVVHVCCRCVTLTAVFCVLELKEELMEADRKSVV